MLKAHLLGPPNFFWKDEMLATINNSPHLCELLSYLLIHPTERHTRSELAGLMWPDAGETTARQNLSAHIWRLRSAFADKTNTQYIAGDKYAVWLETCDQIWLDVDEFATACTALASWSDPTVTALLECEKAIRLYRGDLLQGIDCEWCLSRRERLRQMHAVALETLIQRLVALDQKSHAVELATRFAQVEPFYEVAHYLLVELHFDLNQVEDAKRSFERYKALWHTELNLPPSARMAALAGTIHSTHAKMRSRHDRSDIEAMTETLALVKDDDNRDASLEIRAIGNEMRAACVDFATRLGQSFKEKHDNKSALAHFLFAIKLLRASSDPDAHVREIDIRCLCDEIYDLEADHAAQHANLKHIEALAMQSGDASTKLDATLRRAWFEAKRDRYDAALAALNATDRTDIEQLPLPLQSLTLRVRAVIELEAGFIKEAASHAQSALAIDELTNNISGIIACSTTLASTLIAQGAYSHALAHAERAYSLVNESTPKSLQTRVMSILGLAELKMRKLGAAMEHLQSALRLVNALGDIDTIPWVQSVLCELYLSQGVFGFAFTLAKSNLELAIRQRNCHVAARFALLLSRLHQSKNESALALCHARKARQFAQKKHLWRCALQANMCASAASLSLNRFGRARKFALAAMHIYQNKGQQLAEAGDLLSLLERCHITSPIAGTVHATPSDTPAPADPRPQ